MKGSRNGLEAKVKRRHSGGKETSFQINQKNPFPFYFFETDVYDLSVFYVMVIRLDYTAFCNVEITTAFFTKVFYEEGFTTPILSPKILTLNR